MNFLWRFIRFAQRVWHHCLKFMLVLLVLSDWVVREPRGVKHKVKIKWQIYHGVCISKGKGSFKIKMIAMTKGWLYKVSYQWLSICHVLSWIIPLSHWQGKWFKWESFEVQLQKEQLEIILVCRWKMTPLLWWYICEWLFPIYFGELL
jgi:hypothetical protein